MAPRRYALDASHWISRISRISLVVRFLRPVFALSLAWCSLAAPAARGQSAETAGINQVLEGDELNSLGLTRLGDVVRYIYGGRTLTIDGFSHRLSLNGLGSFHEPGPALYVDGHPVDLSLFGTEQLNLLGVPIEAIDRIEISTAPELVAGSFAGRGVIHIRTRPAVEGVRGEAAVSALNEVGDPGPFGHLEGSAAPNIDTQGPNARGSVEAADADRAVRAAAVYNRHYLTKPVILARLDGLHRSSDAPVIEVASPAVSAAWERSGAAASILGLGVTSRLYPYLPYASREVALNYRAGMASAAVRHRIGSAGFLRHRVSVSIKRAHEPGVSTLPFEWQQEKVGVNTAWGRTIRDIVVVLGATGHYNRARSGNAADWYSGGLYAAIGGELTARSQYRGGGMIAADGNAVAVRSYVGVSVFPAPGHRGDFYVTLVDDLPEEQDPVDPWIRAGVRPALTPDDVETPGEDVSTRATGDAEWRWAPDSRQELAGGLGVRVSADTYLFSREIEPVHDAYRTSALTYAYAAGTVGLAWLEYSSRLLHGRQRLFWNHQMTLGGDRAFRTAWRAVPRTSFGMSLYLPVTPDFQVHTYVSRQSGSSWHEFNEVGGVDSDVAGSTLVDLGIYKRLGAGRVHLRLALINLFRDDLRSHPLGDTFDLTAHVDLRVEFGKRR